MARSTVDGRKGPDAWGVFDRIRREIRSLHGLEDPGDVGPRWDEDGQIGLHEDEAGFVLVARPLADPVEQLEISIDWDEVVLTLPPGGDPATERPRRRRVRLPAPVDPDGAEVVYADGILVLRLPRRALRAAATLH